MGQAKSRGTFEERKQQSIAAAVIERNRRHAELECAAAEEQARVDAMPEEEREAYVAKMRKRRRHLGAMIGMATTLAWPELPHAPGPAKFPS